MIKTKLEKYLYELLETEEGIVNEKGYINENNLENKYRLNRFKISGWLFKSIFIFIPFAYYYTETGNKYGLLITLIIMGSLLTSSFFAVIINESKEELKNKWLQKEWEGNTGLEYKVKIMPNQGFSTINIDTIVSFSFLAEGTNFMKRLSGKSEDKQRKLLKRALLIENF